MVKDKKKGNQRSNDSFIGLLGLQKRIPKSKSWIYKQIELGLMPPPYKIGRSSLWSENEVDNYIDKIKAGRVC